MSVSPFLRTEDVADLLGCSRGVVQQRASLREIPHRKPPGSRRCLFLRGELDAWLDGAELEVVELPRGGRVGGRRRELVGEQEWTLAFPGQRTPFEAGNEAAVRHGAYSPAKLAPRAQAIERDLRAVVPTYSPSDEHTVRLLALVLARVEAANEWLFEHGIFRNAKGEPQPILKALSTWENSAARLYDRLGLTPTARAALGLQPPDRPVQDLDAYLASKRSGEAGRMNEGTASGH